MPLYELFWYLEDGPGGQPSSIKTRMTATTPEKAASRVFAAVGVISEDETDGYTLTITELDEDGEPVAPNRRRH